MKQLLYCIICLILGTIMCSWTLNYRQPWSLQHNDHSLTNAVNHIFSTIYNLNYITVDNNLDYQTRDNYERLMSSGFTDSVKFKVGDTVFIRFEGPCDYLLWNGSEKHPKYYEAAYSNIRRCHKELPVGISPKYLKYFDNWDAISARNFHDSIMPKDDPDCPNEIIRFIITKKGMRIDAFEY